VQYAHERTQEPPEPSEGFSRIDVVAFERRREPSFVNRAAIFWYDGVLRRSRSGQRTPHAPDDVELLPGRRETLARLRAEGWRLLGLSWQPECGAGTMSAQDVAACFERTHELLGTTIEVLYCPHEAGPPVCWCRKPLPGLGVVLILRHRLDAARCLFVGSGSRDAAFARSLGFQYREGTDFFTTEAAGLTEPES
jgi:histidinol phosphatase-like enzyme